MKHHKQDPNLTPTVIYQSFKSAYRNWLERRGLKDTNDWSERKSRATRKLKKNAEYLADLDYERLMHPQRRNLH